MEEFQPVSCKLRNLTLGENLKVLNFLDKDNSSQQASYKFGIEKRTVNRIVNSRSALIEMDRGGVTIGVRRIMKPRLPDVEQEVTQFV